MSSVESTKATLLVALRETCANPDRVLVAMQQYVDAVLVAAAQKAGVKDLSRARNDWPREPMDERP